MDNLSSYCSSRAYKSKVHASSSDKTQKANYAVASSSLSAVSCTCSYQTGRRKRNEFDEELL